MANPKARAADYVEGFGLTAHEFELVRSLPDSAHCFLVKHGNESVVVRLDLTGERELLTILSGRERTVRLPDELRAERGAAPAPWSDPLTQRACGPRIATSSPVPRASPPPRSPSSPFRTTSPPLQGSAPSPPRAGPANPP